MKTKTPSNISTTETKIHILDKFGIDSLNPMQIEADTAIRTGSDVMLLSPTGTGKTLAFLLPLIDSLEKDYHEIQLLILVPSRELALQIEQVCRNIGSGLKVNAVFGGRSPSLDKLDLKHRPAILIATPGRFADRLRRDDFPLGSINTVVLDEFDKSLEVGFEKEMKEIIEELPFVDQRILTSATSYVKVPDFVGFDDPIVINYLNEDKSKLKVKTLLSTDKDKLKSLQKALAYIGPQPGIIFSNHKDALKRISGFLQENSIEHECFHGGMEQVDRERALLKFRNGSSRLLLATDLAARGLDIPEIKFILHYHLPLHKKEFTHRNGRTARMDRDGIAYVLHWQEDKLPDFIQELEPESIQVEDQAPSPLPLPQEWKTLYISGGRRDKISKGDIAGLFFKQGEIKKHQLGLIEVKQTCAYAAVHTEIAEKLISKTNNSRLKKKKVRITFI